MNDDPREPEQPSGEGAEIEAAELALLERQAEAA